MSPTDGAGEVLFAGGGPGDTLLSGSSERGVSLRRLVDGDLEYLYKWENDPAVWPYGDCGVVPFSGEPVAPFSAVPVGTLAGSAAERFSRGEIAAFIENQRHDIGVTGQMRFMICRAAAPVGFIDLFDYDEASRSAGVGVLICEPHHRGMGCGGEALRLLKEYARRETTLRELWCDVAPDNAASRALFTAAGFRPVGQNPDGTTHLALPVGADL